MSDRSWIYTYDFLGFRLFELPSFLICVILIVLGSHIFKIPRKYQVILVLHCFLPFILNDVLFSVNYMPDQYKYWIRVHDLRSGELGLIEAYTSGSNVARASIFLAALPFPAPVSHFPLHNSVFHTICKENIYQFIFMVLSIISKRCFIHCAKFKRDFNFLFYDVGSGICS